MRSPGLKRGGLAEKHREVGSFQKADAMLESRQSVAVEGGGLIELKLVRRSRGLVSPFVDSCLLAPATMVSI